MDQSIASEYDFKTPNQDSNQYPAETAASSYSNHHTLYQDTAAAPLNISNDSTGQGVPEILATILVSTVNREN